MNKKVTTEKSKKNVTKNSVKKDVDESYKERIQNKKIGFFKRRQMSFHNRREKFKIFRKKNKHWVYYTEKIYDLFNYTILGSLISLPFFNPSILTYGLGIAAFIYLYDKKIHEKLIQLFSSICLVKNIGYRA